MSIYDEYLKLTLETSSARAILNSKIKKLDMPDLYAYDTRYTTLFLLAEVAFRDKGYFISADLKNKTNLSDKSVERFINTLIRKDFYKTKVGQDKRIKMYYPTKDLSKHIMATWPVRINQIGSILGLGEKKLRAVKSYLENTKTYL